jgi:glycine hydroxymethyltransferase
MKKSWHYSLPNFLRDEDPEIFAAIEKELSRQEIGIELIASENYASPAVMAAMGSPMTNKYAEGYPGKRYYGGCEFVDIAEALAISRLKKLFSCDETSAVPYSANVQPHSGAQANMAVFLAMLQPGDTIMGLDLSHGGHLTHGSPVNFSGKIYQAKHYTVDRTTERLNYEEIQKLAEECRPKILIGGASAYSRHWDFPRLAEIAKSVGAYFLVDMAHIAGLVAAGVHPSPIPHADFVTSTTHKTLRGPRGGIILCRPEFEKKINSAVFPGMQGGPLMHVIAAKAVAFHEALQPNFRSYQEATIKNAAFMSARLSERKLRIVSGGTDNHLALIDVGASGLTGKIVERALDSIHITVNKNTIPFETKSPFVTSGIRIGSPAVTSRGMGKDEMLVIADAINESCEDLAKSKSETLSSSLVMELKSKIEGLCQRFPLYK